MANKKNQKIVTFGGGTGQYHLLTGLREVMNSEDITAVAGTWDSGGSSGRLRSEMGVLPPGDIRRCVLALMEDETQRQVAQRLFDDRLDDLTGPLKGHSFGNLITARLDNIYKGQDRGIDAERHLFRIKSKVMPVSVTNVNLIAETNGGDTIVGETNIDLRAKNKDFDPNNKIIRIYFDTRADNNPEVLKAVKNADKIVFSPGDLYTSVLPHLLVDGVVEVIKKSKAKLIFVLNLATKPGETDKYSASDFVKIFLFYLGLEKRLDFVLANKNSLDKEIIDIYKKDNQELVRVDSKMIKKLDSKIKVIQKPIASYIKKQHLLRHDPKKLAKAILEL
jgi:uncharacterized cofD-like protein